MRVIAAERWNDPERAAKMFMTFMNKRRTEHRTDIEDITETALQALGIDYEFERRFGRYFIDFYLPDYHIGLECDGVYWHRNTQEKDAQRDAIIQERHGLIVVRIAEVDIKADIYKTLKEKLFPRLGQESTGETTCKN